MTYALAIDIGASSGRHIVGWYENGQLQTEEVYRFPNGVKEEDGHLIWDIQQLNYHVVEGIRRTFEKYTVKSLSIDTWGVDYVRLQGEEEMLPCFAYRDTRTEAVIDKAHEKVPFAKLYAHTGCQFLLFQQRQLHCHIGLRAGVRLHIGIGTSEELLSSFDRDLFDLIDTAASAVIAMMRIPFRVLVGKNTAKGGHHRFAGPVL